MNDDEVKEIINFQPDRLGHCIVMVNKDIRGSREKKLIILCSTIKYQLKSVLHQIE